MMRWLFLIPALFLTGCMSLGPSDEAIKALASSERSWCVSITSVYGTARLGGTGVQGGSMTCTQEGLAVKDDSARLSVPIVVAPQISVSPTAPVSKP